MQKIFRNHAYNIVLFIFDRSFTCFEALNFEVQKLTVHYHNDFTHNEVKFNRI